ncbi:ABC transporter substrate-binding protein [Paenibacillus sp. NPDC058174]|uniref:ABC transporter substrate-binding protein n=1 Tax=Paenibacillus sp. NPDC058174 TaxID=3346366 RepID=UPI0036DCD628
MKMKAYSSILLALCLALVISACSQNTSKTDNENKGDNGKVTLKLWYWNGAFSDASLQAAKEKFPNINLEAEKLPSGDDYLTKLRTTLAGGGNGPDIVAMDSWVSSMLQYKDQFVNLYDQGARDIESQYLDWKWKLAADQENSYLIGLPIDVAPVVLFYRTDLFKQAGVASTPQELHEQVKSWEDYFELLKKVKDKTGSQTGNIADIFRSIVGQSAENFFDKDGKYIGDQGDVKRAWDLSVKAFQDGLTFPFTSDTEKNAAINANKINSFNGASWSVGDLVSAAPDTKGKWGIAYPPGGVGNQGGSFLGALKHTKHPKEAYEVIKFLVSPDNLVQAYKEFGNYPSTPGIYNLPEMESKNDFFGGQNLNEVFSEAAKDVQVAPTNPQDIMVLNTIVEGLTQVDTMKKDSNKAWEEAQTKVKRQLSR